ncbi:hypothetical protein J1N35_024193 [Gossypium stocksii]|uniref:Uncharacterized protein n=1 Tax=Gossypium stocksii TaxID=47602 RepID=A0A9D3VLE2_9ROSI|nr:hypothetical protein J1N35_024193 [Gossypium stocksii]
MTNELPLITDELSVGRKQDRFRVSIFASVGQIVRLLCTLDVSPMLFEVVCRQLKKKKQESYATFTNNMGWQLDSEKMSLSLACAEESATTELITPDQDQGDLPLTIEE